LQEAGAHPLKRTRDAQMPTTIVEADTRYWLVPRPCFFHDVLLADSEVIVAASGFHAPDGRIA
jgi:hypothetical protein